MRGVKLQTTSKKGTPTICHRPLQKFVSLEVVAEEPLICETETGEHATVQSERRSLARKAAIDGREKIKLISEYC